MKRFITYLYDYKNGQRNKNTGFVRVDIRGKEVRLEIHICNAGVGSHNGKVYLLIKKEGILGLCIGELMLKNGMADERYVFSYSNVQDSGFDFINIMGVAIRFENGYLASNWNGEECKALESGEFTIFRPSVQPESCQVICQELDSKEEQISEYKLEETVEQHLECETVRYEKIQLTQMGSLHPKHRHLCSNSFLIHGFFNYQYIVRKNEMVDGEEIISIGVPGVFEQPEKMIAGMFGFLEFEALSEQNGILERKEINQELKEGTFGAWFMKLFM